MPAPRVAMFGGIGPDPGVPLDQGLVIWFPAPGSYTGEDVVEFQMHGSPFVLDQLVNAILDSGLARLADPGEFTRRAFLSGKLDLTDAERIHLMIEAETALELQVAAASGGPLRHLLGTLREKLMSCVASLEAVLEYPEEGETGNAIPKSLNELNDTLKTLDELAVGYERYGRWVGGIRVALAGIPNAGKSSLLNRMVGFDRAIVTELPGTTTDTVDVTIDINGLRVSLVDTAGLRNGVGRIERAGLERSHNELAGADLIVGVLDPTSTLTAQLEMLSAVEPDRLLLIWNKSDLVDGKMQVDYPRVSALTGSGVAELLNAISNRFMVEDRGEAFLFTVRQARAANAARERLQEAREAMMAGALDLATAELSAGLWHLDSLVGRVSSDEILDAVFGEFCLGK